MTTLEQVREGEVPAELAGTYRDIRHALRLSHVPLPFRALGAHRGLLKAIWKQLAPNVCTRAFEEAADELRARLARAAVDLGTPLIEPVLASVGLDVDDLDEVRAQVELFHYADPKVLLCTTAIARALEGHRVGGQHVAPHLLARLPELREEEMPALMPTPEEPGGVLGEIFHEILELTHLPVATIDLRALGHWPQFLAAAWSEIGPVFRHRGLGPALEEIRAESRRQASRLPYAITLEPGALGDGEHSRTALARIATIFDDAMPRMALFASALTVALDGAQDALDSPYPIEWNDDDDRWDSQPPA